MPDLKSAQPATPTDADIQMPSPQAGGSVSNDRNPSSLTQALARAATATVQPFIQTGQAIYKAGQTKYNSISPTLTKAYQEFERLQAAAQQPPQAVKPDAPGRTVGAPPLEPLKQHKPEQLAQAKPSEPPRQTTPKPITPIRSLPNANLARTLTNYNMPSSFTRIPNLNSSIKPINIDMPFDIALNKLKYENIPMTNLQIKPLPAIKPITNPAIKTIATQPFNKLVMPKITPINTVMVKPMLNVKPIAMPKPIVNTLRPMPTPKLVTPTIPKINPINNTLVKPIASIKPIAMPIANIKPLTMPKPIVNTLRPMPNIAISAMPKIKPIDNTPIKPIASIKPIAMPKPIVNTLRPIQTPSFVKYTIPPITPMGNIMVKPIASIRPLPMPKPIATNIKAMPMPKFAQVDIPSLNYMSKKFNFEMPKQLESITTPKITPIKMAPIRLPDVEIPRYSMPQITVTMPRVTVTEVKYQTINTRYVEKTIKLYDAKVMHDASRINSMISPSNNLQKYFNGNAAPKIDLTKFIQNTSGQRKEIINQAQIYTNSAEVKKLEALDTWRNEYDKFMALSSNISNVVRETGQVDPASLDYLENVKENLDTLTRNITDMGIDKKAMQKVIKNSGETAVNPLMKEKVPMPLMLENPSLRVLPGSNIAPKVDILNSFSRGVSNIFTSTVHAEEQ